MSELLFVREPGELRLLALVPLNLHPAAVYLEGLGEGSRPTMRHSLDAIASLLTGGDCDADTLNWAKVRSWHTAAVRAALKKRYAPATTNKMLVALRRVLKEAHRLDLMDAQDYTKAVDFPSVRETKNIRGRAPEPEEIAALMDAYQSQNPIDIRDAALIVILRGGGLRRAEAVHLDLSDFKSGTGALEVRRGKGGKDRTAYLPEGAISLVEEWLDIRGREPGPLLCPVRKGGQVELRQMTADAVLKMRIRHQDFNRPYASSHR